MRISDSNGSIAHSSESASGIKKDEIGAKNHELQPTDEDIKRNRLRMTMFEFVVSYPRWSIPILIFLASLSLPLAPSSLKAARIPYQRLQTFVKAEAHAYYECTVDAFEQSEEDMREVAVREQQRAMSSHMANQEKLEQVDETTRTCAFSAVKAREALHQWSNGNGQQIPFRNASTYGYCSNDDVEYIATSLGKDYQEIEYEVNGLVGEYVESSESSLGHVKVYAQDRIQYDYNFFVRDRLVPLLQVLQEFSEISLVDVQFSIRPEEVVEELIDLLTDIELALEKLKLHFDVHSARLHEFYASISNFLDNYEDLYLRLTNARGWALKLVHANDLPDFFNLSGIPLAADLMPPIFEIPELHIELLDIHPMLGNFSDRALQTIWGLLQKLEEEAVNALSISVQGILGDMRGLLAIDDYDPPGYAGSQPEISSMEEEANYLSDIGKVAKAKTLQSLRNAKGLWNASIRGGPSEPPDVDTGNYSFKGNSTRFEYHSPKIPEFALLDVIRKLLGYYLTWQIYIELLIQGVRLWRLKRTYEQHALPDISDIEFVKNEKGGGEEENSEGQREVGNSKYLMLKAFWTAMKFFGTNILLQPAMLFLLVGIPFGHILSANWYPHVQASCVSSRNGTAWAKNVISPIVINAANAPGHSLFTAREADCRQKQRILCNFLFAESDSSFRNDVISLSTFAQRQNRSKEWLSRVKRCVDFHDLDSDFRYACCGLEGYSVNCEQEPRLRSLKCPIDETTDPPASFMPIGHYAFDPACQSNSSEWAMKDSRFNCSELEASCSNNPCTGVNEDLIRSAVIDADCLIELYSGRIISFFLLVLYHAGMINLFCPLIFNGLKLLLWRQLCPSIGLRTLTGEDGALLRGSTIEQRRAKISKLTKRIERTAVCHLAVGVIFFLFWIISFSFIGSSVVLR